jgi:hypothetical protein
MGCAWRRAVVATDAAKPAGASHTAARLQSRRPVDAFSSRCDQNALRALEAPSHSTSRRSSGGRDGTDESMLMGPPVYTGVYREKGRFKATLPIDGRTLTLGRWETEEEAAVARDRAILHFNVERPLCVPRKSKKLGPASPADLRRLAVASKRVQNGTSQYRGVTSVAGRWVASVGHEYKTLSVGGFDREREAAEAYDRLLLHLGKARTKRNFPKKKLSPASVDELRAERRTARRKRKLPADERVYRGVYWNAVVKNRPWEALISLGVGKTKFCGMWRTARDAARAYDRAATYYWGANAEINFPSLHLTPASPEQLKKEAFDERKQTTTSVFRGVSWQDGAWTAAIGIGEHTIYLGRFGDDEEAAARAYDKAATKLHAARARLNFPRASELKRSRR